MVKIACGYTCVVDVLEICKGEGSIFVAAKQTKQCKVASRDKNMEGARKCIVNRVSILPLHP